MGRITVFSTNTCPHCARAKEILKRHGAPFTNISLTDHPDRRPDMLALSDRMSVPQIFFNSRHIGGADDLQALDTSGQLPALIDATLSAADPVDTRLSPPPASDPSAAGKREGEVLAAVAPLANDVVIEYTDVSGAAKSTTANTLVGRMDHPSVGVAIDDRWYHMRKYSRCFVGEEAVTWLAAVLGTSREQAVRVGGRLFDRGVFEHVVKDHAFEDAHLFYRRAGDVHPMIINTSIPYRGPPLATVFGAPAAGAQSPANPPAVATVVALARAFEAIVGRHHVRAGSGGGGGGYDYEAVARDSDYRVWHGAAVCALQAADPTTLENDLTRIAFWSNVYNMLVKHAHVQLGVPTTSLTRVAFFHDVSYRIGGATYSLHIIENGLLRRNRRAPFTVSLPLSEGDVRMRAAPSRVDPRIHFALNCGAASCPPVKEFSAAKCDSELEANAIAFCESSVQVRDGKGAKTDRAVSASGEAVSGKGTEVAVSSIFSWYAKDFGADSLQEIPERLLAKGWLRGRHAEAVRAALLAGAKVVTLNYDWGSPAARHRVFRAPISRQAGACM
eukprot:TRINITY_DN8284_c0_g2_i1.p1 TRINITY_DN8284_c0_g2~~TRINITY_DN8284_c0_g2_i1.p1  ORF type:complete len:559 (-),score=118.02 TRINITY_DN8284_c0_g2_i1:131-1807(-)